MGDKEPASGGSLVKQPTARRGSITSMMRRAAFMKSSDEDSFEVPEPDVTVQFSENHAATRIQRFYRMVTQMHSEFGPMIFCKNDGTPANYGKLLTEGKSASFITVSDTSSPALLMRFMAKYWRCAAAAAAAAACRRGRPVPPMHPLRAPPSARTHAAARAAAH